VDIINGEWPDSGSENMIAVGLADLRRGTNIILDFRVGSSSTL
jgi:hypothetical protein